MRNVPAQETKLTEEQQRAFEKLKSKLLKKGSIVSLKGYAGTGKTTLLRYLANEIGDEFTDVYMAAPTHKAAEVLGRKLGRNVSTVHSLFGLRPKWDGRGGYKFVRSNKDPVEFTWGSLLGIDEGSMVPPKLHGYVEEAVDKYNLSVVYAGDPAQLPPVNEEPSPTLAVDGYMLENIVRQAQGNPIIEASMEIRNHDNGYGYEFESATTTQGGVTVVEEQEELLMRAIEEFDTEKYKAHGDHARILAYRNNVVSGYNEICRDAIYGDQSDEQFIEGEWLVAKSPWGPQDQPDWMNVIATSEEFVVRGKEPNTLLGFDSWILEISSAPDTDDIRHIEVLNRDEVPKYEAKMDKILEKAKKNGKHWKKYYHFKEAFAEVDYSYAMTVHRSQGSTFSKVFIDAEDITSCPNTDEIGNLLYVAVTRASEDVVVYQW